MKLEDQDFETLFQTALMQFDDTPPVKHALIGFYRAVNKLLVALVRADAQRRRRRR